MPKPRRPSPASRRTIACDHRGRRRSSTLCYQIRYPAAVAAPGPILHAVSTLRFHAYLPQYGEPISALVEKAWAAEDAGFEGVTFFDHLSHRPPIRGPIFDAMVAASWVAANLEAATIGHLCLCDALRHPAVLAKQAVSLDHATHGRFELGIGWGSAVEELVAFGLGPTEASPRIDRFRETLEILKALWSGESIDYQGTYFSLRGARQDPSPLTKIPIVIGGGGKRTRALVAEHADWWNLRTTDLHHLEAGREEVGKARLSIIELVGLLVEADSGPRVSAPDNQLLEAAGLIGSSEQLVEHFEKRREQGFERAYIWLVGSGPETISAFGETVVQAFLP